MDKLENYNPRFSSPNDAIAFAVHLTFLTNEFKLVGLNENQYLEDIGSIPQGWNDSNEMYAFRYIYKNEDNSNNSNNSDNSNSNNNSSNNNNNNNNKNNDNNEKDEKKDDSNDKPTYLCKILSLDKDQVMVSVVKQGGNKVSTLDLVVSDHLNVPPKDDLQALRQFKKLFKNLNALLLLVQDSIIDKVLPNQPKKKDDKKQNNNGKKNAYSSLIVDDDAPRARPGGRPMNPYIGGGGIGGIGGDFGGDLGPGGMGGGGLMGPDHGRFRNIRPNGGNGNNPLGPNAPPGARFDPFGPGPLGQRPGPDPDHEMRPGRQGDDWMGGGNAFGGPRNPRNGRGGFGGGAGGGFGGGGFGGFGGGII